ncbi:MAG: hypothetical protein U0586_02405 [Candidatus Brocadiaceae bacterium]
MKEKLIAIVAQDAAVTILKAMKNNPLGKDAAIIGSVVHEPKGKVLIETIGNKRMLDMLTGEQLPRIC